MTAVIFGLFACIGATCLPMLDNGVPDTNIPSLEQCEAMKHPNPHMYDRQICLQKTIPVWAPVEPED